MQVRALLSLSHTCFFRDKSNLLEVQIDCCFQGWVRTTERSTSLKLFIVGQPSALPSLKWNRPRTQVSPNYSSLLSISRELAWFIRRQRWILLDSLFIFTESIFEIAFELTRKFVNSGSTCDPSLHKNIQLVLGKYILPHDDWEFGPRLQTPLWDVTRLQNGRPPHLIHFPNAYEYE